jgi:hypothetical protein
MPSDHRYHESSAAQPYRTILEGRVYEKWYGAPLGEGWFGRTHGHDYTLKALERIV